MRMISIFDLPSFGVVPITRETLLDLLRRYTSISYMPSATGVTTHSPCPIRIDSVEQILMGGSLTPLAKTGYYTNTPCDGVVWFYGVFHDIALIVDLKTCDCWVKSTAPNWHWEQWLDQTLPVDILQVEATLMQLQ